MLSIGKVWAFVRLGRPLFLGGGFLLYALGATIAAWAGARLDWAAYGCGQLGVTAFQLMTHYGNDYFDLEADRANATPTRWSGGSRVLPGAQLAPAVALYAALAFAGIGIATTLYLGTRAATGPWVMPALLAAGALAWLYSAPPLRLHSTGFGELDTALVVTALVPFVGFHLQTRSLAGMRTLLLSLVPLVLLQFAMLLAIGFPDAEGDAAVGKRTLVVRLGPGAAARLYLVTTAAAFLSLPLLLALGLPMQVAAGAALVAPVAGWHGLRARSAWADARRWESLTFWAVAVLIATAAGELAGFALLLPR